MLLLLIHPICWYCMTAVGTPYNVSLSQSDIHDIFRMRKVMSAPHVRRTADWRLHIVLLPLHSKRSKMSRVWDCGTLKCISWNMLPLSPSKPGTKEGFAFKAEAYKRLYYIKTPYMLQSCFWHPLMLQTCYCITLYVSLSHSDTHDILRINKYVHMLKSQLIEDYMCLSEG